MRRQAQIDAGVGGQVLRLPGLAPAGKIGWCADHGRTKIRSDAHRDHVLRHQLPRADPRVVALGHNVGEAVIDDDLDLDVRILRQQFLQPGPQHGLHGMVVRGDANGARRLVAQRAERGQCGFDLVKARSRGQQQALARLGGRNAARGPGEQTQAEPSLKAAQCLAQGGLRHTELRRRPGEALLPRHSEKGREVVQVSSRHS